MKRTLLLTLEYPPQKGGVSHYLSNLVTHLPRLAVHVLVNGEKTQEFERITVSPFFFKRVWPRWLPAIFQTWRAMRKQEIEMLWVGQVLPLGSVALILHKVTGVPYFVSTYGMDVTMLHPTSRKGMLAKKILNQASFVITISEFTKQAVMDFGVPEDRIHLVYPCPNVTPDGPSETPKQKNSGEVVILSFGRLVKRKGQDKLIEAMPKIIESIPTAQLWIVGEGEDGGYLRKLSEESPAKDHIHFFGWVSDESLRGIYQQATIFAMPARSLGNKDTEGFGIVYLEANSFGLPVIGGNTGGVPDAISHNESGYLVDGEDADAITERILFLLRHPEEARRLGEGGRRRVHTRFQWPHQAKKLANLLV